MADTANPLAPHHLPWFITQPGETDVLLVAMAIFLVVVLISIGNLYFKLHSMPERWSHGTNKVQMEIVAVLCILALFTHNHVFWIAALLLALVQFPDFSTPMHSIADSLERLSGRGPSRPVIDQDMEPALIEAADRRAEPPTEQDPDADHRGSGAMIAAAEEDTTHPANGKLKKDRPDA